MAGTKVPRDPNITAEMRRFLDYLARASNICSGVATAAEATALLNVFTSTLKGLVPASGGGTTTFLRADATFAAVPADALPAGTVVQVLQNTYATNTDLSTTIPADDTIPLISEGTEVLSQAITPASASNKVICIVQLSAVTVTNVICTAALFRGSTCINAKGLGGNTGGSGVQDFNVTNLDSPASASAQTYSVRVGPDSGTMRLNGTLAARLYGGASACTLTLMEIKG